MIDYTTRQVGRFPSRYDLYDPSRKNPMTPEGRLIAVSVMSTHIPKVMQEYATAGRYMPRHAFAMHLLAKFPWYRPSLSG